MSQRPGFTRIKLGDTVKPIAVERYKGSKGQKEVVSILTNNISAVHMHFTKGIGGYYCFGGACCKLEGMPAVRYIIPIVKYSVTNPAQFIYSSPVFVQYLAVGKERYDEIVLKDKINKDITAVDMVVSCVDDQYQKLSFEVLGPALWRTDKAMTAEVKAQYVEYQNLIENSVARMIDEPTFMRLYSGAEENKVTYQAPTGFTAGGGLVDQMALKPAETLSVDISTKEDGEPDFSDLLAPDISVKGSVDSVPF
jgi:hypothetical protein